MTPSEYLSKILDEQTLSDDDAELPRLRERRKEVESLLRADFGSSPTIRYGGSKAKGTMIKEAYDLDIICYFPRDDDDAGGTLEDIFENVKKCLSKKYVTIPKTSAIRLQSMNYEDFHVDVVPGRYVDDDKDDCFLHQTTGEKKRLKTNLNVHIEHVRESGVIPAIRLMKLWRVRNGLSVRNFVLELMTINIAEAMKSSDLDSQLRYVWRTLRDDIDSVEVEDPANPTGNDLSHLMDDFIRQEISTAASRTLASIERDGWEAVFGKLSSRQEKRAAVIDAARSVSVASRPWWRS